MIDPIEVKQAIKDGQIKIHWTENRPNIITVYLSDVIRKEHFIEELGDTVQLCEIQIER